MRSSAIVRGADLTSPAAALVAAAALLAALAAGAGPAAATTPLPGDRPGEGALLVASGPDRGAALPLASTDVAAHVVGFAAQVRVRQAFSNPFDRPLEAVYVFPLPHEAAVSELLVTVGDRRITGEVMTRADAAAHLARARAEGRTAALLEQERPNVFTQTVTNVQPRETVQVELVYDLALEYRDGGFEFVYPMVVGPRYIPGTPDGKPPVGTGTAPDTDQVPDASRITPPTLPAGERSGRTMTLEVTIDPGARIQSLDSPTHEIAVDRRGESTGVRVALVGRDRIPNRDFVLRYRLAGRLPAASLLAHRDPDGSGGTFALLIEVSSPPARAAAVPRELVFVLDRSGSMGGRPFALAVDAMRQAIATLGPRDTFRVIGVAGRARGLGDRPVRATAAARRRALAALDRLQPGGATELSAGLRAALAGRPAGGRVRVVCLVSDGLVGDDEAILAEVAGRLDPDTRLFTVGIGSSVNRSLLDRLAEIGRGSAHHLLLDGPAVEREVAQLVRRMRLPVFRDIAIDWGELEVEEVWPRQPADLAAGSAITMVGRYRREARGRIKVSGRVGRARLGLSTRIALAAAPGDHRALPRLWARRAIAELTRQQLTSADPALERAITDLALRHRLVSAYTSLVAVDERRLPGGGVQRTYLVPVDLPAGVTGLEPGPGDAAGAEDGERIELDREERSPARGRSFDSVVQGAATMETSALAAARWRFGVGLGAGIFAPGSEPVGSFHLRADRPIKSILSIGGRLGLLGLLGRNDDLARIPVASLQLEVGVLRMFGGPVSGRLGLGPALVVGEHLGAATSVSFGIGRRVPIELRAEQVVGPDLDVRTVTLGVELSF